MRVVSSRNRGRHPCATTVRKKNRPSTGEVSRRRRRLGPYSNKYSYLCKDSIVEVTSKISGYVGSWYEAKVLEPPVIPKSKFKRKRVTLVEYTNLLNSKRTRLLRERVDAAFVRPLPPTIVADEAGEEEGAMIFKVGEEVDTYDRDGWWAGVLDRVVRRRMEDGKEKESYVVRFDDPEHEIEFRGHELRLHLDWYDGKWFVSRDGKSQGLSVTSDGCVSLASIRSSFKGTKTIDKAVVLGFGGKYCPTMAPLDGRSSSINRKTGHCVPMRFIHEIIDPEYPRGSSFSAKKMKRTCMEGPSFPVSGTSAESTSELCDAEQLCERPALWLTNNDVNPSRECENKELTGPFNEKDDANNHIKLSNRRRKSSKPSRIILATGVVEKADGAYEKSSMEGQLCVGTRLTREEKQGLNCSCSAIGISSYSVIDKQKLKNCHLNRRECHFKPEMLAMQNAKDVCQYTSTEKQSIAAVLCNIECDPSDKEQGEVQNLESINRNPSVEETSHMACRTELNSRDQGHSHVVENGEMSRGMEGVSGGQCPGDGVVDVDQSFPFVKTSPIWQAVESLEVFQKFPQNPHFLPLIEEREGVREGLAIAKMVTFANIAENIIKLSINDPDKSFTDCLETLRCLELHGFDTKPMENRLTRLINLKDEGQEMKKQKNEIENQISELTHAKAQIAKDVREIVDKIRSYQEELTTALLCKEEKDSKILILKTSLELMDRVMHGARVGFDELNISW